MQARHSNSTPTIEIHTMTTLHDLSKLKKYTPDESHWNPEIQELTIDLTPLLNQPVSLVLTGWQSEFGISWRNEFESTNDETENIIEVHNDPFEASLFPIEFINHEMLKPWRVQMPDDLLALLKCYKGNAFGMLILCSRHSHVYELFQNDPTMFWLVFTHAQQHDWSEVQFVATCRLKRTEQLKACFLPARKSAVKLLRKLRFKQFAKKEYDLIIQLFNLDFEVLNHRTVIDHTLIRFLVDYPRLIDSQLIQCWESDDFKPLSMLVNDIERMSCRLHLDSDTALREISHCTDMRQIQVMHDKLVKQLNDYLQRIAANNQFKPIDSDKPFSPPPLPGNQHIVPITDLKTLQDEGIQLQHCVAGYDYDILEGRYYVYRIMSPERATLGIKIYRTRTQTLGLRIDQLKGFQNQTVSHETRKAVLIWFNTMQGASRHD